MGTLDNVNVKENKWFGTEIAATYPKGEVPSETSTFYGYTDSDIFSELSVNVRLSAQLRQLRAENAGLIAENEALKAKVAAMQATNSAEEFLKIRELPRDQAKEEIQAFFKAHHGKTIYPSDVMEALSLDYDLVYEICEELEKEGMVKGI